MTETFHGTTILSVRRDGAVALGGDGQVTLGQVVIKATRAQGAPALPRQGAGGIRRRHGRCVHAVRALRGEAREAPGTPDARGGRAREGLALRSRAAPARSDARDRRSHALARRHRHRRRARARARHRRDRLGRPVCAGGGAGAARQHDAAGARDRRARARRSPAKSASTRTSRSSSRASIEHDAGTPRRRHRGRRPRRPGARRRARAQRHDRRAARSRSRPRRRAGPADVGCARLRDQPRQRVVPAAHRRVAGAAVRAHRRRSSRCASSATPARRSSFSAYELGERALAWIVEERALRAALLPAVHVPGIDFVTGAPFASLAWSASEGDADARRRPPVRGDASSSAPTACIRGCAQAAGIVAEPRSYGQQGVVANFDCELAHHGCARQWFRDDGGVLAWLPLPGRRISIVWSAPDRAGARAAGAVAGRVRRARRRSRRRRARRTADDHAARGVSAAVASPAHVHRPSDGARRRRGAWRAPVGRAGC